MIIYFVLIWATKEWTFIVTSKCWCTAWRAYQVRILPKVVWFCGELWLFLLGAILFLQVIRFFSDDYRFFWTVVTEIPTWLFWWEIFPHHFLTSLHPCMRGRTPSLGMRPALFSWMQAEVISGEPVPTGGSGKKHIKISVGFFQLLILTGKGCSVYGSASIVSVTHGS